VTAGSLTAGTAGTAGSLTAGTAGTAGSLTAVVAVLLVGVWICVAPALTRPTLQFGVRVPPQHTGATVIRRERRAYYWCTTAVVVGCAAAALALAGSRSARLTLVVLPAELAAGLGCFWVRSRDHGRQPVRSRLDTQPREPEGVAALRRHPGRHRRAGGGARSGGRMTGPVRPLTIEAHLTHTSNTQ
jgi:hypothetical protein